MKSLREMVLAHSSYAKAAGLQSEISRQTVGRVAGSEVEYKRQMNLYKKDMMITISNVRREQRELRKSMKRYSKKKRQNKIERRKREQEDLARDQRTQEHLNVLMIWRDNTDKTPVSENKHTSHPENQNTEMNDEIHKTHETDKQTDITDIDGSGDNKKEVENHDKHVNIREKDTDVQTNPGGVHLPAIVEDNEQELQEELENEKSDNLTEREDSGFQEFTVTPNESSVEATSAMSGFPLAIPQLKPKKQVVSYADLIKLQHTSNTKKLFNLVNLLAKKHGIAEQNKKPTEVRNSSVLRGSTNESWTDTMLRTGSVFYPMKYGYVTDPVEDNSEDLPNAYNNGNTNLSNSITLPQDGGTISENSIHKSSSNPSSKDATPLPPLTSRPNSQRVESQNATHDLMLSSKRMHKRNKSMPVLINDYNKIKKMQSENFSGSGDNKVSRHSTQSTPSAPRRLHPLNTFSSEKTDAVSWHEAFGLLKGVHTLNI